MYGCFLWGGHGGSAFILIRQQSLVRARSVSIAGREEGWEIEERRSVAETRRTNRFFDLTVAGHVIW
jgi:hypothetical protein